MPVTLQPTSLKYKDSNGVFQNATAIQGESPVVAVADITNGHRITITDAEGTHSFDVMDGDAADAPVQSVNGQTGAVVLDAADVGAGTYSKPSGGIPASDLAAGVIPAVPVQDVQVNGVSVLSDGVANVPIASSNVLGVAKFGPNYGINITATGQTFISGADSSMIKNPTGGYVGYRPIVAGTQHAATFYGLAKAAGSDEKNSALPVGQYTESAKSAISTMLSSPVAVTGTTPSITALPGIQYVCGECVTLDITLPASGIVDVVFESGSTPTVLTVTPPTGMTVEWANGFDSTSLEADTLYELNIKMVGTKCLGVAVGWT